MYLRTMDINIDGRSMGEEEVGSSVNADPRLA